MKQKMLGLDLDYWDDSVGAFEPEKCINRVCAAFKDVDVDVDKTDHQEIIMTREVERWIATVEDERQRDQLIFQSKRLYRANGPTYRFVIRFGDGHEVHGTARRLYFYLRFNPSLPNEIVTRLRQFLLSLSLGSPKMSGVDEQSDGREVLDQPF
ncbi:MAG: hypothetical protein ABL921_31100 [Pirellula sp.]